MSKLDLTSIDDKHMTNSLLDQWLEVFRRTTGNFPEAILITLEQGKKFFLNANEVSTNYKGVPLELQKSADETVTIIKSINAIMSGMHTAAVKDASDVYRLLEAMKAKVNGDPAPIQGGQL